MSHCGGALPGQSFMAKTCLILHTHKAPAGKMTFQKPFAVQTCPYLERLVLQEAPLPPPRGCPGSAGCTQPRRSWPRRCRRWAWAVWRDVCENSTKLAGLAFPRAFLWDAVIHLELAPSHTANGSTASLCWCINRAALLRVLWLLAGVIDLALMLDMASLQSCCAFSIKRKTLLWFFFTILSLGFSLQHTANSGFGQKSLQSYLELKYQHVPSNSLHFSTRAIVCFLFVQKKAPFYLIMSGFL